jgi:hypothetical protein
VLLSGERPFSSKVRENLIFCLVPAIRLNANFRGGKLTNTFHHKITVSSFRTRCLCRPAQADVIRFPGNRGRLFCGVAPESVSSSPCLQACTVPALASGFFFDMALERRKTPKIA